MCNVLGSFVLLEQGGLAQEQAAMDIKAEKAALGPNADAVIKSMVTWGNGLVQKGIWGADDYEEFKIWGGTANGIKALQKLRATYEGRVPVEAVKPEGTPKQRRAVRHGCKTGVQDRSGIPEKG